MFFEFTINLFHATSLFLYPCKYQKTRDFLMFSRGIKRDQGDESTSGFVKLCTKNARNDSLTHFSPMFHFYTP